MKIISASAWHGVVSDSGADQRGINEKKKSKALRISSGSVMAIISVPPARSCGYIKPRHAYGRMRTSSPRVHMPARQLYNNIRIAP